MTRRDSAEEYGCLLERLKAAYEDIDPSEGARLRIRSRVFASGETTRGRRLANRLAWVAVAVVPWVFAVALYFHVTSAGDHPAGEAPGVAGREPEPARPETGETLSFGPHRVELGSGTRLVPLLSKSGDYEFDLVSGHATFRVAPLEPGRRFSVRAGDVVVEVVGTVFSVERDERCVRVVVEEGTVRAVFGKHREELAAGQNGEMCAPAFGEDAERDPDEGEETAAVAGLERREPRSGNTTGTAEPPEEITAPVPTPAGPTEEELLYREALDARLAGDIPRCRALMGRYVGDHPDGTFTDEALFTLVRLDYRAGDFASAKERAGRYLARNRSLDAKTAEARLLRADSLERLGGGGVLAALRPLAGSIDVLAPEYREQALYLLALSAGRAGDDDLALRCARECLARFPAGKYAERAAQIAKKLEAGGSEPAPEDTVQSEGGEQP